LPALSSAADGRDAIIHLAAEHRDDAISTALCEEVNVGGAENVVRAARQVGCRRIVFTSSVAVYPLNVPQVTEDSMPQPYHRYGESKLEAERLFTAWAQDTAGASLTIIRPCVIFGEGNRGNVHNLIRQIQHGDFVMVGSGRNRKSMAYVGNLTRFLAKCVEFPPGVHLYNYADRPDLSVSELVALARQCFQEPIPRSRERKFADAPSLDLAARTSHFSFLTSVRLPFWLGLCAGHSFDVLSKLSGHNFSITASRIRKFCAETTVSVARLDNTGFVRPYRLEDALRRTIRHEFLGRS
jgi:nucleoside-diphosphate-sugar epimerase